MGRPYTEEGSCRDDVHKGKLEEECMCSVCREHARHSDKTLRRKEREDGLVITGVCKQKYGPLSPATERHRAESSSSLGRSGRGRRARRSMQQNVYKPAETKAPSGKKRKLSSDEVKRNALATLGVDENIITINRGGTSASAKSKMAKTTGAALTAISMAINPSDPSLARNLGIAQSLKRNPIIPPTVPLPSSQGDSAPSSQTRVAEASSIAVESDDLKARRERSLIADMGRRTIEELKKMSSREARPLLAAYANHHRPTVERVLGRNVSKAEWQEVQIHARFPGPFQPIPNKIVYRQRIPTEKLQRLLTFLDSPGMLQKFAFGSKLQEILHGENYVQLDATTRLQKARKLAVQFILMLDGEVEQNGADVLDDSERCTCMERDSLRRCMLPKGHKSETPGSKCKFTPKGSLSIRTVEELINHITMDDIKKLSGLDDTKVECGRENFDELRELVNEYCGSEEERRSLQEEIDTCETFYQCDYIRHLSRTSEYACACLTCGFSGVDGIECGCRDTHKNSCVDCARGFKIIRRVEELHQTKKEDTSVARSPVEQNRIEDDAQRICECRRRLNVYRSHLARHLAEGEYEHDAIANLPRHRAETISDFKCRILSCFFREGQQKFFGKKGTACLGFMVMMKCLTDDTMTDAIFVYMMSNDTTQDAQFVLSGKYELYKNHLPARITETGFRCDGAGCFSKSLHYLLQHMWKEWTGIAELSTSHSPAGGGKTSLDGGFGRVSDMLHHGVDEGHDIYDAESIVANAEREGGGLTASTFAVFLPGRHRTLVGKLPSDICPKGVLRGEAQDDGSIILYQHSGYGTGTKVYPDSSLLSVIVNGKQVPLYSAFDAPNAEEDALETVFSRVMSYLPSDCLAECPLHSRIVSSGLENVLREAALRCLAPAAAKYHVGGNAKGDQQTQLSRPGMGKGNVQQQQKKRQSRVKQKKQKATMQEEERRELMKNARLYLCDERCDCTKRYCLGTFLTEEGLQKHMQEEKHKFPVGVSSRDRLLLLAAKPGSSLAPDSRPNRLGGHKMHRPIQAAEDGAPGQQEARSYKKFHRPADKKPYIKPEPLKVELQRLFDMKPHLTEYQAHRRLKAMRSEDGSLKFCWSKRGEVQRYNKQSQEYAAWMGCSMCGLKPCTGCNGKCPSPAEIKQYFSSLSQKKKKKKKKQQQDTQE